MKNKMTHFSCNIKLSSIFYSAILLGIFISISSCNNSDEAVISINENEPDYSNGEAIPVHKNGPFYGARYCEILLGDVNLSTRKVDFDIYNSITCNDCPQNIWETLNFRSIAADNGFKIGFPNGPRKFIFDDATSTSDLICLDKFGGIDMSLVAKISLNLSDFRAYSTKTVARTTNWIYYKGSRVNLLEDRKGNCFIMQSILIENTQLEDLETLESKLRRLPRGWSYKSIILENELVLPANGTTTVITDDLNNTYQLLPNCL